jgi:predicted YcjX-like family ATPase
VKPFFRDHFARIDRQVVLVDALGAIHAGPRAVDDLRMAMTDILSAFRPGRNAFLTQLLLGRRVERILFAATKADHLHHTQHPQLTAIMEAILRDAKDRADFAGAKSAAMSIASLRATTEDTVEHQGRNLDVVRGILAEHRQARRHVSRTPARGPRAAPLACAQRRGQVARRRLCDHVLRAPAADAETRRGPAPHPARPRGRVPVRGPAPMTRVARAEGAGASGGGILAEMNMGVALHG